MLFEISMSHIQANRPIEGGKQPQLTDTKQQNCQPANQCAHRIRSPQNMDTEQRKAATKSSTRPAQQSTSMHQIDIPIVTSKINRCFFGTLATCQIEIQTTSNDSKTTNYLHLHTHAYMHTYKRINCECIAWTISICVLYWQVILVNQCDACALPPCGLMASMRACS